MTKQKQLPQTPRDSVLMTIPEAAAYSGWTVFKIRTLHRTGLLRYSQEGHAILITRKAIDDCIVSVEATAKAKREAKLAKTARKKQPPHPDLAAASERGRQRAIELRSIPHG